MFPTLNPRDVRDWAGLPQEVLLQIMQDMSQHDVLAGCALTCTAWRLAARDAHRHITVRNCDSGCYSALQCVLQRCSQQLESVELQMKFQYVPAQQQFLRLSLAPQLPCSKLQALVAVRVRLQAPLLPEGAAATLTKLVLDSSCIVSSTSAEPPMQDIRALEVQELSGLTNLQHLSLETPVYPVRPGDVYVWGWLQHLQGLTHLTLQGQDGTRFSIQPMSSSNFVSSSSADGGTGSGSQDSGNSPARFPALRSLDLRHCSCDLSVLPSGAGSAGLEQLSLHHFTALGEQSSSNGACFNWLGLQRQLTRLSVGWLPAPPALWDLGIANARAFTALVASTKLRSLDLSNQTITSMVWEYIFAADRLLLHLTKLQLPAYPAVLEPQEVAALVRCCPALQEVDGGSVLRVDSALPRLQHLKRLSVTTTDNKAAAAGLSATVSLRDLTLHLSQGARKFKYHDLKGLWQLTALTSLTFSDRSGCYLDNTQAETLAKMTSLVKLDMGPVIISEVQLKGLTALTALTNLNIRTGKSGEGGVFGPLLQERLLMLPGRQGGYNCMTIISTAPKGSPPNVAYQLQSCFTPIGSIVAAYQQENVQLAQLLVQARQQLAAATGAGSTRSAAPGERAALRQELAACQAENAQLHSLLSQYQQWAQRSAALAGQLCQWTHSAPLPLDSACPMACPEAGPAGAGAPMPAGGPAYAEGPQGPVRPAPMQGMTQGSACRPPPAQSAAAGRGAGITSAGAADVPHPGAFVSGMPPLPPAAAGRGHTPCKESSAADVLHPGALICMRDLPPFGVPAMQFTSAGRPQDFTLAASAADVPHPGALLQDMPPLGMPPAQAQAHAGPKAPTRQHQQ